MSKVLLVKVTDRPAEQSITAKMYEVFVKQYMEANADDEVVELDLFKENIPYYGNTAITGAYKRSQGFELTAEEEQAVHNRQYT